MPRTTSRTDYSDPTTAVPLWGLSGSTGGASAHAADPATYSLPGGFAQALCRRTLWVSVDHSGAAGTTPVAAAPFGEPYDPSGCVASVGCLRCNAILEARAAAQAAADAQRHAAAEAAEAAHQPSPAEAADSGTPLPLVVPCAASSAQPCAGASSLPGIRAAVLCRSCGVPIRRNPSAHGLPALHWVGAASSYPLRCTVDSEGGHQPRR